MNIIVQSSIQTLDKSKLLLKNLSDEELSDHSISPYYSCIGSHLRHILDFYDCILDGITQNSINLIERKRDERMHCDSDYAYLNVERIVKALQNIEKIDLSDTYMVKDDLGLGQVEIKYTLGAILAQANSHAIHHYAIISYILDRLEIPMKDVSFGYNPTTPRQVAN